MQLKVLFGRKFHGKKRNKERKKKQQQSRAFFGVIFYVYTNVDTEKEQERITENKGDEFRRKKNMEIQGCAEKLGMLEASKVKMSGSEK